MSPQLSQQCYEACKKRSGTEEGRWTCENLRRKGRLCCVKKLYVLKGCCNATCSCTRMRPHGQRLDALERPGVWRVDAGVHGVQPRPHCKPLQTTGT